MKRAMAILGGLAGFALMSCFTLVADAQEQTGASPADEPIGITFKWIHFAIIAILVVWLLRSVFPAYVRRNADKISAAISKATAARMEAERQLKEAAERLAGLQQEIAEFHEQAQKDAVAELQRLREMMKIDVERVGVAARAEIEAAERAARLELKSLAAKLAVDRAESLVAKQMTAALQEAMINNFVQSLQGRPN
jgi:F-type H+-transporting ATPase subunit b